MGVNVGKIISQERLASCEQKIKASGFGHVIDPAHNPPRIRIRGRIFPAVRGKITVDAVEIAACGELNTAGKGDPFPEHPVFEPGKEIIVQTAYNLTNHRHTSTIRPAFFRLSRNSPRSVDRKSVV
jgi:hypothetical protein